MYVPESTKPYLRRLLFTLITDKISDFGAISVTERSCPAHAVLKSKRHISNRFCATLVRTAIWTVAEVNK